VQLESGSNDELFSSLAARDHTSRRVLAPIKIMIKRDRETADHYKRVECYLSLALSPRHIGVSGTGLLRLHLSFVAWFATWNNQIQVSINGHYIVDGFFVFLWSHVSFGPALSRRWWSRRKYLLRQWLGNDNLIYFNHWYWTGVLVLVAERIAKSEIRRCFIGNIGWFEMSIRVCNAWYVIFQLKFPGNITIYSNRYCFDMIDIISSENLFAVELCLSCCYHMDNAIPIIIEMICWWSIVINAYHSSLADKNAQNYIVVSLYRSTCLAVRSRKKKKERERRGEVLRNKRNRYVIEHVCTGKMRKRETCIDLLFFFEDENARCKTCGDRFRDASAWISAVNSVEFSVISVGSRSIEKSGENRKCNLIENERFSPAWSLLGLISVLHREKEQQIDSLQCIHKIIHNYLLGKFLLHRKESKMNTEKVRLEKYILLNKFVRYQTESNGNTMESYGLCV